MKRVKRKFSKEFKQEAVKLSFQRDNIKELAIELGIDVARIYKWRTGLTTKSRTFFLRPMLHI